MSLQSWALPSLSSHETMYLLDPLSKCPFSHGPFRRSLLTKQCTCWTPFQNVPSVMGPSVALFSRNNVPAGPPFKMSLQSWALPSLSCHETMYLLDPLSKCPFSHGPFRRSLLTKQCTCWTPFQNVPSVMGPSVALFSRNNLPAGPPFKMSLQSWALPSLSSHETMYLLDPLSKCPFSHGPFRRSLVTKQCTCWTPFQHVPSVMGPSVALFSRNNVPAGPPFKMSLQSWALPSLSSHETMYLLDPLSK